MSKYKIEIVVEDVSGVYSASNLDEANKIGQQKCDNIYAKLNGKCTVYVNSVEKVE